MSRVLTRTGVDWAPSRFIGQNESERTTVLYALLRHCTPLQVRFFMTVLDQMAKTVHRGVAPKGMVDHALSLCVAFYAGAHRIRLRPFCRRETA